ncbi:SRPBCC family protein [Gordonia soli]|uniref:Coenzyme Q-binding protein COQ10 START domain-containing protein n=1 Tax=Gordonia soli NBRC 108243 TaxID=1223545 RepID=M0QIP7_9ACTN|nr:SRPBCC family protein [Gordonia soli]GAC67307.1 hypothetical protein GS4_07_00560 [Gordonia soli NBRC 108243]
MGIVRHRSTVETPRDRAFAYVNDHRHVPDWMFGVDRFDPVTDVTYGLGATFDIEMRIGPKALSSTVEVTEFVENEIVRLEPVKGFAAGTVWRFADVDGGTDVDVEFTYDLPGGIAGRALGAVIEPAVGHAVRQTDSALRSRLEAL